MIWNSTLTNRIFLFQYKCKGTPKFLKTKKTSRVPYCSRDLFILVKIFGKSALQSRYVYYWFQKNMDFSRVPFLKTGIWHLIDGNTGVGMVLGLRQINTCCKVPLLVNFLDGDILHCFLWVLSFYAVTTPEAECVHRDCSQHVNVHFAYCAQQRRYYCF